VTLLCTKCPFQIKSLILDKTMALKECCEGLMKHALKYHQEEFTKTSGAIQGCVILLAWLISMEVFAEVPEDETFVLGEIDKNEKLVFAAMGFEGEEEVSEVTKVTSESAD
jgi:hypothetical protein